MDIQCVYRIRVPTPPPIPWGGGTVNTGHDTIYIRPKITTRCREMRDGIVLGICNCTVTFAVLSCLSHHVFVIPHLETLGKSWLVTIRPASSIQRKRRGRGRFQVLETLDEQSAAVKVKPKSHGKQLCVSVVDSHLQILSL